MQIKFLKEQIFTLFQEYDITYEHMRVRCLHRCWHLLESVAYIYIQVCVSVCVCVCLSSRFIVSVHFKNEKSAIHLTVLAIQFKFSCTGQPC